MALVYRCSFAGYIFEPFRRLHSDNGLPGTGLGLASIRRIIEQNGGRIWVESEPGLGSTFFFTVKPAAMAAGENSPAKTHSI
jgi:signal transduction histidine kinase